MIPLEKQEVTRPCRTPGGVVDKIPALHPDRVEDVHFITLTPPPPPQGGNGAEMESWLERASFIEEDLTWLLKLPHDRFWCQAIFDSSLQRCLTSILSSVPRPHDRAPVAAAQHRPDCQAALEALSRLCFLACLRMATHKESAECHITPAVFGEIIYDNFLFDVARLFDICVVYGNSNRALVQKMVDNVFRNQPKYHSDLRATVPTLLEILDAICDKCGVQRASADSSPLRLQPAPTQSSGPPPRGGPGPPTSALVTMSAAELEDVVSYWMDVCQSFWAFLQCYHAGAVDLAVKDFPVRLAGVYETLAGAFAAAFASRTDAALCARLKGVVHRAQACLLHAFQRIIHGAYVAQPARNANEEGGTDDAEKYLDALMAVVGERRFIAHHQRVYPFSAVRAELAGRVDDTRLSYVSAAIDAATAAFTRSEVMAAARAVEELDRRDAAVHKQDAAARGGEVEGIKDAPTGADYEADDDDALSGAACAAAKHMTGVELDSLISSIQDLMPELGRGFIRLCLEEYDYDNERVIHALLEDRLCPALRDVDRSLAMEPDPEPEAFDAGAAVYQPSVLDQRRNVFDNDEFDVLSHEIDVRRVHVGKRERVAPRGEAQFLNDKSSLAGLRPLMERYANEDVESMYDKVDEYEDGYEDEYDDTYDSNAVGAIDADSADELTSPPPRWHQQQREEGGARGPLDTEPGRPPRDLFIEDPAKLRQIREEKHAEAMRRRGKGAPAVPLVPTAGAGEEEKGGARTYDTKGGPKGQGQSAEVLHNRAWKEKHKGSTVHHNRKAMSDRKHRQF